MALLLVIGTALVFGLLATVVKLPPMVGFLLAGFTLQAALTGVVPAPAALAELNVIHGLDVVADTGVTLLLFTIGLKLDIRSLVRPEVLGTAMAHMLISTLTWAVVFAGLSLTQFPLFTGGHLGIYLMLGFALAFSSTIFVVKTIDEEGQTGARFGVIAVGVLVIQDIAAAVFMSVAKGTAPSIWALLLVGSILPAKWIISFILSRVGRGEILIIFGVLLALGGYQLFELVNLKGDLGAITMGALIAGHPRAKLIAERIFSFRELLLVGFFLSVGQYGLPGTQSIIVASLLTAVLPIQTLIYLTIFRYTRLRVRTAAKSALLLTNYSEFGLIAGVVGVKNGWLPERWMVALALAVALSFVFSTILNANRAKIVGILSRLIPDLPAEKLLPQERPINFESIDTVVFGMGNLGAGAYKQFTSMYGRNVRGIDLNTERVEVLHSQGIDVVEGDATDPSLWERMQELQTVDLIVLAMPDHEGNLGAFQELLKQHVDAFVAVVARDEEQLEEIKSWGADLVIDAFSGAGAEIADAAERAHRKDRVESKDDDTATEKIMKSDR